MVLTSVRTENMEILTQQERLEVHAKREQRKVWKTLRKWELRCLGRRSVKLYPAISGTGTTCLICDGPLGFSGFIEIGGGTNAYIHVRPRPGMNPKLIFIGRICVDCEQVIRHHRERSQKLIERLAEKERRGRVGAAAAPRGSLGAALSGR